MKRSDDGFGHGRIAKRACLRLALLILFAAIFFSIIYGAAAMVQIDSTDYPASIEENTTLNMSFEASSSRNLPITYAIYSNGTLLSNTNGYVMFADYASAGVHTYTLFAADAEGNVSENISVEIVDVPLVLSLLSPDNATYNSRVIDVNVTTTRRATGCTYQVGAATGSLALSGDVYHASVSLGSDGAYLLDVSCHDAFDSAHLSRGFSVDSSTPIIASKAYSISSDYSVTLSVMTDGAALCKYDSTDRAYDSMYYSFAGTAAVQHSATLTGLADGSYTYYIRCKDINGNTMQSSEPITFALARKPSAAISLSKPSPLKAGTYEVDVVTSKPVQSNPSLFYTFNNDNTQRIVSLTGSGSQWKGYMIIDDNTPNKIGTFHFSATDMDGLTGTLVTQGELFLIDTIKPPPVSSIEAIARTDGNIELRWYYDGEELGKYKIYRSVSSNVDYVDYLVTIDSTQSASAQKYVDDDVMPGTTYYYKISSLDKAGNEGPLSDVVYAVSSGVSQAPAAAQKTLNPELSVKVDAMMADIDKMLLDVASQKEYLDKISDNAQLKVVSLMKLSSKIAGASSSLEGIKSQLVALKETDYSASELDIKLNKLRLDAIKAQSNVVEDIKVEQLSSYEQITTESDVENAIALLTENMNVTKKVLENYSSYNKKMQDGLTVKTEVLSFRIKFLGKDDYDKYTIIKKSLSASSGLKDVVLVESIPKEVEKRASDISLDIVDQKYPVVLKEDPVLKWSFDTLGSADIYYAVEDIVDLSSVKNSRSVVITRPDFKFTERMPAQGSNSITGFVPLEEVQLPSLSFMQWLVIIGVGMVFCLGAYYVRLDKKDKIQSAQRVASHQIIRRQPPRAASPVQQTVMQRPALPEDKTEKTPAAAMQSVPNPSNTDGSIAHVEAPKLHVPQEPKAMPTTYPPVVASSSKAGSKPAASKPAPQEINNAIKTVNAIKDVNAINNADTDVMLTTIDYCNSLINNLDYEKSRALYSRCLKACSSPRFKSRQDRKEAEEMLHHIYLKLYCYSTLHTISSMKISRPMTVKNHLAKVDECYALLSERLSDVDGSRMAEEIKFMLYLSNARSHLPKI